MRCDRFFAILAVAATAFVPSAARAICQADSPSANLAVEIAFPPREAPPRRLTVTLSGLDGSFDAERRPVLETSPATHGVWARTLPTTIKATSVSLRLVLPGFDPVETSGFATPLADGKCYAFFRAELQSTGAWSVKVRTQPDEYRFAFMAAPSSTIESSSAWNDRSPADDCCWQDVEAGENDRVKVAFFEEDPSGREYHYLFTSPTLSADHPTFRSENDDVAERVFEDRRDRLRMHVEHKTLTRRMFWWPEGFYRAAEPYTKLVSERLWARLGQGNPAIGSTDEAIEAMRLELLRNPPSSARTAIVAEIRERLRLDLAEVVQWTD